MPGGNTLQRQSVGNSLPVRQRQASLASCGIYHCHECNTADTVYLVVCKLDIGCLLCTFQQCKQRQTELPAPEDVQN